MNEELEQEQQSSTIEIENTEQTVDNTEENYSIEQHKNILRNTQMANTIVKGDELMLFQGGTALGYATAHTFNITANEIEVASKDHGLWGASEIGKLDWECTAECYYTDADYDSLFTAMQAKQPITITFAHASNYSDNGLSGVGAGATVEAWTSGAGYTGKAIITSLSANANTGEKATFSVTFKGFGSITKVANG